MTELKEMLRREDVRGVVRSADGRLREFRRQGVIDLFQLLSDEPAFLQGASMADRVVGRGAALLMVKGGVKEVFTFVLSQPALNVLRQAGITTPCSRTSSTGRAPTSALWRNSRLIQPTPMRLSGS